LKGIAAWQDRTHPLQAIMCDWPVHRPARWLSLVNAHQPPEQEQIVRASMRRSRP